MKNKGTSVEQVMEEVNRAVAAPETLIGDFWKDEKVAAPNLSFLYPPYSRSLAVNLDMVSRNWEIESDFELGTRRKSLGGLAVAVKRFTRAMIAWYINPIVHQVRKFNMLVTRTLHDIVNNFEELSARVDELEDLEGDKRLSELEKRIERIERGKDGR